ncbi:MAG: class I SAM-dependent methyltransferase [Syntrophobacteraceae bacterium]
MRILIAIANHGFKNSSFLRAAMREYKSMPCSTDIIIITDVAKEFDFDAELVVGAPTKDPWSLPFRHQEIFARRIDDYDLFIYSEDDMLVTWQNIESFLRATEVLPENYIPGFIRYELDAEGKKHFPDILGPYHWKSGSGTRAGGAVFAELSNYHSACYIVNRNQLQRAIRSGGYLVRPHKGRYDLLCSAATDVYVQCGFGKLICISDLADFSVHHMPNNYQGKMGLSEVELNVQIEFMLSHVAGDCPGRQLLPTQKNIDHVRWDKLFYDHCDQDLLSLVRPTAGSVLSIGCGCASTEAALTKNGLSVTGIPLDPIMAVLASAKGIEVTASDFEEAFRELHGRRFDCIILSDTLQHLPDPRWVLSQARRLISDDGQLIITVPNLNYLGFLKAHFPYPMLRKWNYEKHLLQPIDKRYILRLFERSGFKVTEFHYSDRTRLLRKPLSLWARSLLASKTSAVGQCQ